MCNFVVTNDEIIKAESAVLPDGAVFNEDQRHLIKYLGSCCVQAYAGTGKTCTLVGKLHVLAQKQVWKNGSGICILSHTNVAVDEVKRHVAVHFPGILEYPNFVGTIQEFVNSFLFSPHLAHSGLKILTQDSDRFIDWKLSEDAEFKERIRNRIRQINGGGGGDFAIKKFYKELNSIFYFDEKIMCRNSRGSLVEFISLKTNSFTVERLYDPLKELIDKRRKLGYFIYDESFVGALEFIEKNPIIIKMLQSRFSYVFLDEAQDCSSMQLDVLSKVFSGVDSVVFQQVGDENQEISENVWRSGDSPLSLAESIRFSGNMSGFINKFKLSGDTHVLGVSEQETSKVLIVYSEARRNEVLERYSVLIQENNISFNEDEGFHVIASEHKVLETFCSTYSRNLATSNKRKKTSNFDNDDDYLLLLNTNQLTKYGQNHIFNTLFELLYKHYRENGEKFELKRIIRTGENSENFKKLIQDVSRDILENGYITNVNIISESLNEILGEDKIILSVRNQPEEEPLVYENNVLCQNNISLNLGTIHAAKGQTHSTTLLLSITERSRSDFEWAIRNGSPVLTDKYKKYIYVASSRPKHLFVVAMSQEMYEKIETTDTFDGFTQINLI